MEFLLKLIFSARCNIYISRLRYDVSVRLYVCPSVCDGSALWSRCMPGRGEGSSRAMLATARPSCILITRSTVATAIAYVYCDTEDNISRTDDHSCCPVFTLNAASVPSQHCCHVTHHTHTHTGSSLINRRHRQHRQCRFRVKKCRHTQDNSNF